MLLHSLTVHMMIQQHIGLRTTQRRHTYLPRCVKNYDFYVKSGDESKNVLSNFLVPQPTISVTVKLIVEPPINVNVNINIALLIWS